MYPYIFSQLRPQKTMQSVSSFLFTLLLLPGILTKIGNHNCILQNFCKQFNSVSVDISAGMPKFLGQLQNVTVSEGRDATFTCSVTNLGGHKVAWIKSDTKAILAIHYHVITNNDNLQVTHNDKDTWTLVIKNVRQKDAGEYMCQVNSVPMVSQVCICEMYPFLSQLLYAFSVFEIGCIVGSCHSASDIR